ncbi:MAG: hypothetical protein D6722_09115, partial [Bacteroidetes bacterium]
EWLDFTVEAAGSRARLRWTTAREEGNAYFEVERSRDGRQWERRGQVAAGTQPGGPQAYTFEDAQPLSGEGFYRLRQVDIDGSSSLSAVVRWTQTGFAWRVYPNPVRGRLFLDLPAGTLLRLLDGAGREVARHQVQAEGESWTLDPSLPPGAYWLQALPATGQPWHRRLQVE